MSSNKKMIIEREILENNMRVISQVNRRGGIDNISDSDIETICRICHLNISDEPEALVAYRRYNELNSERESVQHLISLNGEGSVNNWEENYSSVYSVDEVRNLEKRLDDINMEITKILSLAQEWYDYTGNPNHIKLV